MAIPREEGLPHDSVIRPPGTDSPLGATWTPDGLNLAVRAPSAELIEACLFDGDHEVRVPLEARTEGVHHGFLPGVEVGAAYGLRAHGPWSPRDGLRFNPAKLLVDPYARAINGDLHWSDVLLPGTAGNASAPDSRDSAAYVPRSIVVDDTFDWGDDRRPRT